jgi:hypothetical protein
LGGRCIGIGSCRAAPGLWRNAAERGCRAKAEAGEARWGARSLEAPVGSKEDTTGDGYRGGGSRRRGAEEKHAEGRSEEGAGRPLTSDDWAEWELRSGVLYVDQGLKCV